MVPADIAARAAILLLVATGSAAAQHHAALDSASLGTVHFETSCHSAVRPTFDRGVALLHSFEFGASARAFREVLASDSTCAMAYWGLALGDWGNPMAAGNRAAAQLAAGRAAADSGKRLGARATDRERGYITAVARGSTTTTSKAPRRRAWPRTSARWPTSWNGSRPIPRRRSSTR